MPLLWRQYISPERVRSFSPLFPCRLASRAQSLCCAVPGFVVHASKTSALYLWNERVTEHAQRCAWSPTLAWGSHFCADHLRLQECKHHLTQDSVLPACVLADETISSRLREIVSRADTAEPTCLMLHEAGAPLQQSLMQETYSAFSGEASARGFEGARAAGPVIVVVGDNLGYTDGEVAEIEGLEFVRQVALGPTHSLLSSHCIVILQHYLDLRKL